MKGISLENALIQKEVSRADKIRLVLSLSIPAILAQLTSIAMQYIDAGMVGSLGAEATASIGLVAPMTWLIGGSCIGISSGFYVQVAQLVGGRREREAENVLRQGLKMIAVIGILLSAVCLLISGGVPKWLGGEEAVLSNSTAYFRIYSLSIPFVILRQMAIGTMQSTGDMKTPSALSASVCLLDVVLNMLMIFPTRMVTILGLRLLIPGAGLKVVGAALATALSDVIISVTALFLLATRNKRISLMNRGSWKWRRQNIAAAAKIGIPLSLDHIFMCSALVAATKIVAGLGTVPVAANSLAITAESLCYMPGFGIGAAATAIIGQTIGAGRQDLTRSFAWVSVFLGMAMMGMMGAIMYVCAPVVFALLTSSAEVAALGTEVLRIELVVEPMYGAAICCGGVFRGAGDTLRPSVMNLVSIWCVRIVLALYLVPRMGLKGYWTAMAMELCFRGLIFLIRLYRGKWMKKAIV